MSAAERRAHDLMAWAPCAPVFVRQRLDLLLERDSLIPGDRRRIMARVAALRQLAPRPRWAAPFPVVSEEGPPGMLGGLLFAVARDPGVLPPRGAVSVDPSSGLNVIPPDERRDLSVAGLPDALEPLLRGRSGAAALWLAASARRNGRIIPDDLVVSADLEPGPSGEPRLVAVEDGPRKAAVVARERPGARLLLCAAACEAPNVELLPPGAPVRELERRVWGEAATTDRESLMQAAALAKQAFDAQDYARAAARYEEVHRGSGPDDAELVFEACLRLAAVAIHRGRPDEAERWFARADAVNLPATQLAPYAVERLASLAGARIDAFDPRGARALLERPGMRRAAEPDHLNAWEQIQALGAWRRLHLLEGQAHLARDAQLLLTQGSDQRERPRALLDLAWTELRAGDTAAGWTALASAEDLIALPGRRDPRLTLQLRAFLCWYAARLAARASPPSERGDLLAPERIAALLADPGLQAAPRWRLQAVQQVHARAHADLRRLAAGLSSFQRWYLGIYLLDHPDLLDVARDALAGADVDLSAMPALALARERLLAGERAAAEILRMHAAY